jgi:hypothetical protein
VARLQLPAFHFADGSGQAVQYHPPEKPEERSHPSQASTTGWQLPPLKVQPLLVMKTHATPGLTVVQSIGTTSLCELFGQNCKTLYFKTGGKFLSSSSGDIFFKKPLAKADSSRLEYVLHTFFVHNRDTDGSSVMQPHEANDNRTMARQFMKT